MSAEDAQATHRSALFPSPQSRHKFSSTSHETSHRRCAIAAFHVHMHEKVRQHIVVTAATALIVAASAASILIGSRIIEHPSESTGGDSIGVYDVEVDKQNRAYVDITFDRPIAVATSGTVISPPP